MVMSYSLVKVASAGYGLNDISALELLTSIKSDGGLVVAVLLMPFCFEGQRRRKEVMLIFLMK